ncbi:hypothetical protein GH714_017518 [Hevea brasiliensis]|uniref:Uncharacterized protein n=1 Tax=Hevea brasiliensis TaxID=3981 RepID=A0A6A6KR23_HEVBR|nr:hypothetical protein GH714_017518 [Hevea brasiliensis]
MDECEMIEVVNGDVGFSYDLSLWASPLQKRYITTSVNSAYNGSHTELKQLAQRYEALKLEPLGAGRSSGLTLMWKKDVRVSIVGFSSHHIEFLIDKGQQEQWRVTGIYGCPRDLFLCGIMVDQKVIIFRRLSLSDLRQCGLEMVISRHVGKRIQHLQGELKRLQVAHRLEENGKLRKDRQKSLGKVLKKVMGALKQMHPLKVLGPDGMHVLFFSKYWNVVGQDVLNFVLGFLNTGVMPPFINHTFLTLIPKVKARPISQCNVLYKLISKVLANRLRKALHI